LRNILGNIHIEDMRRGVHDHLMFGEGEMDFVPLFQSLRRIDYQGGVHVELSRHSHDAVNIARKSLAFLRPFTCDIVPIACAEKPIPQPQSVSSENKGNGGGDKNERIE